MILKIDIFIFIWNWYQYSIRKTNTVPIPVSRVLYVGNNFLVKNGQFPYTLWWWVFHRCRDPEVVHMFSIRWSFRHCREFYLQNYLYTSNLSICSCNNGTLWHYMYINRIWDSFDDEFPKWLTKQNMVYAIISRIYIPVFWLFICFIFIINAWRSLRIKIL